jgi:hypothetical protein
LVKLILILIFSIEIAGIALLGLFILANNLIKAMLFSCNQSILHNALSKGYQIWKITGADHKSLLPAVFCKSAIPARPKQLRNLDIRENFNQEFLT